jgi:hypothetical protein
MTTTAIAAAAHTAGHSANPLNLILLGITAAALYMLSLYAWPLRRCPRCRGTRVNRSRTGRRFGLCKRCAGTGQVRRIGATTVHRLYWSALGDRLREHRREIHRQTREHSGHPDL